MQIDSVRELKASLSQSLFLPLEVTARARALGKGPRLEALSAQLMDDATGPHPYVALGIAKLLAKGETTGAAARKFGLSAGRISQLRQELAESWVEFQGELAVA